MAPTLRLVETNARKAWAAYTINDEVIVYVKYALTNRQTQREEKSVWNFQFQPSELMKIVELRNQKPVYVALVCGFPTFDDVNKMQVCLLDPSQIDECVNVDSAKVQTITVEYRPGGSLRAYGPLNSAEKKKLVISRNRLDTWNIPGS